MESRTAMPAVITIVHTTLRRHTITLCDLSSDVCSSDLTSTAPSSPTTVSLSGNGVKPVAAQISITPTALSFGNQSVGSTSAAKTVTLQNTGTANLTISAITSSSPADRKSVV